MQAGQAATHLGAVNGIAVADEVTWRRLERECLPQLPADPCRRGRRRNVEMNNTSAGMAENDEHIKQAKGHGGDDEKIHRGQRAGVVGQEGTPGLRGWLALTWP